MRIPLLLYLLTGLAASAQTVWTPRTSPYVGGLYRPAGKPGNYLVPTSGLNPEGDKAIYLRSTDGVTWTPIYLLPTDIPLACYNNRFVGIQRQVAPVGVWYSDDGTSATPATITGVTFDEITGFHPLGIAFGNNVWIIMGAGGRLLRSADNAATWQFVQTQADYLYTIAFGAGVFVMHALNASLISPDGLTWTIGPAIPGGAQLLFAGKFLTNTHSSPNGMAWSELPAAEKPPAGSSSLERTGGDNNILSWTRVEPQPMFYYYGNGAWQGPFPSSVLSPVSYAAQCGDLWIAVNISRIITSPVFTRPTPAAPPLTIAPALKLSWPSESGRSYIIQRSTDQTVWTDHTGIMSGTGATMEWLGPASAAKEFFRLQIR